MTESHRKKSLIRHIKSEQFRLSLQGTFKVKSYFNGLDNKPLYFFFKLHFSLQLERSQAASDRSSFSVVSGQDRIKYINLVVS